jgi:hypothetical protein
MSGADINGWYAVGALMFAVGWGLLLAVLGDWRTRRARRREEQADQRFLEGRRPE